MNLSPHVRYPEPTVDLSLIKPCWEWSACSRILCPAYGNHQCRCWMVPNTLCNDKKADDFIQKLSTCLLCSYFASVGQNFSGGMHQFLSEQLRAYHSKALTDIYQKEESFIDILNRIPDGLFTTDDEWRITFLNPAAEKITGFLAEDALGMYCKDVFKNTICETDCALKQAMKLGHSIHDREYQITNIDGEKIPVMCSTSFFRDKTGRLTGGIEIFKNITELKQLQEEISRREKKYRRIFEGSHDMIYTSTIAGDLIDVNQAGVEMMGYSSKEDLLQIGSAKRLYLNPGDREHFLDLMNRYGYVKDYEVDFVKRDGTPMHVLISSRKYENPITDEIELEGIIKDITHRKRMENSLEQRNRELMILNSIALATSLSMDETHILTITLNNLLHTFHFPGGAIFLINREKKKPTLQVSLNLPPICCGKEDEVLFKDSLLMKHLVSDNIELSHSPTFPVFQAGYRTRNGGVLWLSCYLILFKRKPVGFFGIDIPSGRIISSYEIHFLGSVGSFLGSAIENIRMMKTIRQHQEQLSALTEKLFQSQEEERRRIARELHDEAGQSLTAVKLGLDRLEEKIIDQPNEVKEELADIRMMITRTAAEIRQLSYRLHPTLLMDLGLEPALNLYFKEIQTRSNLSIQFRMVGFDHRLDIDTETVIYRFCQEALTNTLKHSGAENFSFSIIKSYPNIIFIAEDDGVGFDGQIGKDKQSLGLLGMRERVSLLGGTFQLRSSHEQGTRIRIEIPLKKAPS